MYLDRYLSGLENKIQTVLTNLYGHVKYDSYKPERGKLEVYV